MTPSKMTCSQRWRTRYHATTSSLIPQSSVVIVRNLAIWLGSVQTSVAVSTAFSVAKTLTTHFNVTQNCVSNAIKWGIKQVSAPSRMSWVVCFVVRMGIPNRDVSKCGPGVRLQEIRVIVRKRVNLVSSNKAGMVKTASWMHTRDVSSVMPPDISNVWLRRRAIRSS